MTAEEIRFYLGKDWPCEKCKKAGAPDCRRVCEKWEKWRKKHWNGIRRDAAKMKRR